MINTFLFCVLLLFTLSACEEKDNGVNDPPENVIDMSTEILNPGFELGDDNWEFIDYATTIDTSNARSGNKSLKLINDFMGEKVPIHMAKQTIEGGFVAGAEYNFKIWVKGDSVEGLGIGGKPIAALGWYDKEGTRLRRELYMWAPYGTYDFKEMNIHGIVPEETFSCIVDFRSWWDCVGGVTYWDDISLQVIDHSDRGELLNTIQAEDAVKIEGCEITKEKRDFTGEGYVNMQNLGSYLQWENIEADSGEVLLVFRYAKEASARKLQLKINGEVHSTVKPLNTGSPESWATLSFKIALEKGENIIRLEQKKAGKGPSIDKLELYQFTDL